MSETPAEPAVPADDRPPVRFQVAYVLYAAALSVSAVTTFGPAGLFPAGIIFGLWAVVFYSSSRPRTLMIILFVGLLFSCLLMPPGVRTSREASRRSTCKNNLIQLGLAMHNYHDVYGSFPPAFIPDENGRPMHSWRVLLLPYIDQAQMHKMYDFNEPWDGPNNRKLLDSMPDVYACPSRQVNDGVDTFTSYVAVVGPRTAWPENGAGRTIKEFTDGTSNTLHLLECDTRRIPWMKPADLNIDEATALLSSIDAEGTGYHRSETFFYEYYLGRQVLLADGSVRFVPHGVSRDVWSSLLTVDDGGPHIDDDMQVSPSVITERLKVGNCCRFGLFMLLVLLPLTWVWLNPTSEL